MATRRGQIDLSGPSRLAERTGGKREKADFDLRGVWPPPCSHPGMIQAIPCMGCA